MVLGKEAAETDLAGYCRFIRPDNKSGGSTNEEKDVVTLSMAERRAEGLLWVDTGENMNQQIYARAFARISIRREQRKLKKRGNFKEIAGFFAEIMCG